MSKNQTDHYIIQNDFGGYLCMRSWVDQPRKATMYNKPKMAIEQAERVIKEYNKYHKIKIQKYNVIKCEIIFIETEEHIINE